MNLDRGMSERMTVAGTGTNAAEITVETTAEMTVAGTTTGTRIATTGISRSANSGRRGRIVSTRMPLTDSRRKRNRSLSTRGTRSSRPLSL